MRFGSAVERIDERIPGVELPLMSVSQTRGVIRRSELTDTPHRAESLDAYKVCRRNDIVFNKMSIRSGAMGVALEDGLVTYHYEVMRPRKGADPRFIAYVMKSSWFTGELIKRERGIGAGGQGNVRTTEVPFSVLKTIDAYIPEVAEQHVIADFLDHETAQIDALVAKQQEFISFLQERRSGLIAAGVTGRALGEDLDDEETSWLGTPPARWRAGRVKHFGVVTLGKMLQTTNKGYDVRAPYMRAANVQPDGVLALNDVKSMWFSPRELRSLNLRTGDVVVVEGGIGGYGRAAFVAEPLEGWGFQNSINRIRPFADNDGRYLAYFLLMARQKGFITAYCNIVSMPHLTAEKLEAMPMFLPPPVVQREIADRLDDETSRIDALIAKAEEHIVLAKERRSALVTAAVTGQIDVRTARKAS